MSQRPFFPNQTFTSPEKEVTAFYTGTLKLFLHLWGNAQRPPQIVGFAHFYTVFFFWHSFSFYLYLDKQHSWTMVIDFLRTYTLCIQALHYCVISGHDLECDTLGLVSSPMFWAAFSAKSAFQKVHITIPASDGPGFGVSVSVLLVHVLLSSHSCLAKIMLRHTQQHQSAWAFGDAHARLPMVWHGISLGPTLRGNSWDACPVLHLSYSHCFGEWAFCKLCRCHFP